MVQVQRSSWQISGKLAGSLLMRRKASVQVEMIGDTKLRSTSGHSRGPEGEAGTGLRRVKSSVQG